RLNGLLPHGPAAQGFRQPDRHIARTQRRAARLTLAPRIRRASERHRGRARAPRRDPRPAPYRPLTRRRLPARLLERRRHLGGPARGPAVIGVLVPAHDEQALIAGCLRSLLVAARAPGLRGEPVLVVVALDACSDGTADICAAMGVRT